MENKESFNGYTLSVWQDADGDWMACLEEMSSISVFGASPEEAVSELSMAWAAAKESFIANGEAVPVAPSRKQYGGHFNVRIAKTRHRRLAVEAAREGVSLNSLVAGKLSATTSV